MLWATTDQNQLIRFNARHPERLRDVRAITGLPAGVSLTGIDFRPATGDLYGVGSDSVVYRVNPRTGIAVAEGPAFTPALRGQWFGVDFNPVPDKIRVVSDARQNLRLNVDEGTVLMPDKDLNPGDAPDRRRRLSELDVQRDAPDRHHALRHRLGERHGPQAGSAQRRNAEGRPPARDRRPDQAGFDIAGANNTGYLGTRGRLYTVDPNTGATRQLGRIGGSRRLVVTGLAAWQDA